MNSQMTRYSSVVNRAFSLSMTSSSEPTWLDSSSTFETLIKLSAVLDMPVV